jgi:AcrR family transcriptional regulator
MTSGKIHEAARRHFAIYGYEKTSMAQIADDVGIKKQSIYSHFRGKDELFLQVCRDVFADELRFVAQYIDEGRNLHVRDFLYSFLLRYAERYETDVDTKFWLRTSFFPPVHLYEPVTKSVYEFLDGVENMLLPVFERAAVSGEISSQVSPKRAAAAYLAVLDGIFVEMLYGGPERLSKRLEASWDIYWRGVSNA